MSKQQFYKNLISGFQGAYNTSSRAALRQMALDKQNEIDQQVADAKAQAEAAKQQKADQLYQQEGAALQSLYTGTVNGTPLTKEARTKILTGLSPAGLKRKEDIDKILNSGSKFIKLGSSIYQVENGKLNKTPIITQQKEKTLKRISSHYGTNAQTGKYGLAVTYENGSTKFFPSLLKNPKKSGGGQGDTIDQYDPIKTKMLLDKFGRDRDTVEALKLKYRKVFFDFDQEKPVMAEKINRINFNNEQTIYDMMPKKTQKNITDYIDYLKEVVKNDDHDPKITMQELLAYNQQNLKDKFLGILEKKYDDKKITSLEYRFLSLWAKFKFGYIIGSDGNATGAQK